MTTTTVTLTDAERMMDPREAAFALAGQPEKMAAYMAERMAVVEVSEPPKPTVSLGEFKGNPMVEIKVPGAKPLNLSVRKTLRILQHKGLIEEALVQGVKDKNPKVIEALKAAGYLKAAR
jgi:hypothetical protein